MKEIHIRSGVERLNLTAFTMLPVIETILFWKELIRM